MTRLAFAPRALADLDRLADFLLESDPHAAAETGEILISGLSILREHPLVGRPAERGYRELVISRGRTGYLALYRYDEVQDIVLVLAIRHQRENAWD